MTYVGKCRVQGVAKKQTNEMLKFAALIVTCLTSNLLKVYLKIVNFSENNEIFVGRCFLAAPCRSRVLMKHRTALRMSIVGALT